MLMEGKMRRYATEIANAVLDHVEHHVPADEGVGLIQRCLEVAQRCFDMANVLGNVVAGEFAPGLHVAFNPEHRRFTVLGRLRRREVRQLAPATCMGDQRAVA